METKVKNREWVKDAAIVFLAVLLVLTFFSNTIMNRTLPEVATAQVTDGSIVAKVRGSGVVTANGKHQVKAKEIRTIRAVMIKAGQEVNAGDVLFVLGEGDATALEQAQDTLRELQYAYQRSAVGIPNFDSSSYDRAITKAQRAMDAALEETDKAYSTYMTAVKTYSTTMTQAEIEEAEKLLAEYKIQMEVAEADLADAEENLNKLTGDLAAAKAEVDRCQAIVDGLEARIAELEKAIEDDNNSGNTGGTSSDVNPGAGDTPGVGDNPGAGDNPSTGGNDDPVNPGTNDNTNTTDTSAAATGNEGNPTPANNPDNTDNANNVQDSIDNGTPVQNEGEITDLSNKQNEKRGGIVFLKAVTPVQQSKNNYVLLSAQDEAELAELRIELIKAKADLEIAEQNYTAAAQAEASDTQKKEAYERTKEIYDQCQERYYKALADFEKKIPINALVYKEQYNQAKNAYQNAIDDYNAAVDAKNAALDSFNRSAAVSYIDLAQQAEKIKLQQEKIKSLAGDEENVITANVSGTVDTVDCTAGDTVLKDAILATIEVPDMGHTLSFSVTNDQAQRLRVGDSATISNYYWGNSITATLTTIRSDPKNPQTNKLLTFDLTGDVTTGAELTISVGQKSANYDLIVPNSAIKSDTNGSYVLAVSVKSSPLGNRYTARRVSVEVLANDDNNSAVVADLGNGDYVITTSSAPLNSGDMVRMADS